MPRARLSRTLDLVLFNASTSSPWEQGSLRTTPRTGWNSASRQDRGIWSGGRLGDRLLGPAQQRRRRDRPDLAGDLAAVAQEQQGRDPLDAEGSAVLGGAVAL